MCAGFTSIFAMMYHAKLAGLFQEKLKNQMNEQKEKLQKKVDEKKGDLPKTDETKVQDKKDDQNKD
jgi:hypothetical protein